MRLICSRPFLYDSFPFFNARRYASAVFATAIILLVRMSVSLSVKLAITAERIIKLCCRNYSSPIAHLLLPNTVAIELSTALLSPWSLNIGRVRNNRDFFYQYVPIIIVIITVKTYKHYNSQCNAT